MRTSFQPLAHLVDAAAEKWLAAEHVSAQERQIVRNEITQSFRIGDNPELTFHGLRFLLSVRRYEHTKAGRPQEFCVEVHEIVLNN